MEASGWFILTKHPWLFVAQVLHLLLESRLRCEAFIPSSFELAGDQPVVRIKCGPPHLIHYVTLGKM